VNEKLEKIIKSHLEAAGLEYHPPAADIRIAAPTFTGKYHPPAASMVSPDMEQAIEEITDLFRKVTAMPPGAQMAAQRRKVPHTCPVCGISFQALRTARYCSNACKQRAKRKRVGK
jgi:hypothetical protein